ncbi:MAG TPA: ATP-binding protein [Actinomycetota bacterium]
MSDRNSPPVIVEVPAAPEQAYVLRSVVASVAARFDLPLDSIEDLKIAVDEAVAHLLTTGGTRLRMEVVPSDSGLKVTTSTDASQAAWPPEGFEGSLTWQVLTGLTDEAWFAVDGGPILGFTKRALLHG